MGRSSGTIYGEEAQTYLRITYQGFLSYKNSENLSRLKIQNKFSDGLEAFQVMLLAFNHENRGQYPAGPPYLGETYENSRIIFYSEKSA